MKIQDKDLYHGCALTQIVEHESFKALNKADGKYGHYQVNTAMRLLLKYSTKGAAPWQFTFQPTDLATIRGDITGKYKTFACLVCGKQTVCLLDSKQVRQVINLKAEWAQTIIVELPSKGASLRARGTQGRLENTIPHSRFPDAIFGSPPI